MPTTDRTTIRAAIDQLESSLRANVVANPPTAQKPFRQVLVGSIKEVESPRPFLVLQLTRIRPVATMDDDKLHEVTMAVHVVTDVSTTNPHDLVLDQIGAVEDYLDTLIDTGVLEGAEGFDDRTWTFEYPRTTSGARIASASATQSFLVKVQRQQNRVPAP